VYAATGERVGWVAEVLDDAAADIFDGIVMQTDRGLRFVDAPEVERCAESAVRLRIDAADAARLPAPRPVREVEEEEDDPLPMGWSRPSPAARLLRPAAGAILTLAYAIAGTSLPPVLYGLGMAVCVGLLVLWFARRRRGG
jgi:hypothetical protein